MGRPIIEIDDEKCNGCGQCILDCAEGALAIVDDKARLISETYCDGLGACLNCPQGALRLVMRDAPPFDEQAALAAKAQREKSSCRLQPLQPLMDKCAFLSGNLPTWPIQLALTPANAKFPSESHLLLAAHCAAFALPDFHDRHLRGRIPLIACPKLQDNAMLARKLGDILQGGLFAALHVLRMNVPCCSGLEKIAGQASSAAAHSPTLSITIVKLE